MKISTFELERSQSLWENKVKFNLTESGLHPYSLADVLSEDELYEINHTSLGYGYTDGHPDLKAQIALLYPNSNPDNVLITNGSAEANFIAMWTLLEPGDEIVYMVPNYMQIHGIAESLGVKVVTWELKESLDWMPDVEELKSLVSNKTKLIVLCNPNNPTGAVLHPAIMQQIVNIAAENDCYIHSDEIYRGSELKGEEGASFSEYYEKSIIVSGLSKALGFPGLRIGWILAADEIIENCWSRHDYTSICCSTISQYAAIRILAPGVREKLLTRGRLHLQKNLAIVEKWIDSFQGRLHLVPPQAGGMAYVGYDADISSQNLVDQLRDQHDVFLVAGSWFGMEGFLRIGIGVESDTLEKGLAAIEPTLKSVLSLE